MNNGKNSPLLLSLVVNGLLMGFIVGDLYRQSNHPDFPPGPPRFMALENHPRLTPELREKIENAMKAGENDKKGIHEKVMKARTEAVDLMKQEPFDEPAFRAKVGEMFALMGQMGDHVIDTMVSIAKDTNAQDRAVIAEILIRPPGPGPDGRGPDGRPGDRSGDRSGGPRPSPDASEEALPDHP